ncbi:hypothetical protein Desor_2910 [Desulfosporosinus orientis DSM 765]|uniref:Uncharacterized protein n=1 Tax=Desulfosporosinus orientis (strain ATCC 19365 / DSM 765 / NCIMB 8382 / VKM B-1628 / Singapore I) TaxID=768706 RepID=G7WFJ6_DESOD|nr:hypothetical protein Desor_2910 [Desulfosporosinus orientis DSM 765]
MPIPNTTAVELGIGILGDVDYVMINVMINVK